MKNLLLIFILLSGSLFSQVDTIKKWDISCYKVTNSFYLYSIKGNGIIYYNFSSNELTDFSQMFWKESRTIPLDTTIYSPYLIRRVGRNELHERILKELK